VCESVVYYINLIFDDDVHVHSLHFSSVYTRLYNYYYYYYVDIDYYTLRFNIHPRYCVYVLVCVVRA